MADREAARSRLIHRIELRASDYLAEVRQRLLENDGHVVFHSCLSYYWSLHIVSHPQSNSGPSQRLPSRVKCRSRYRRGRSVHHLIRAGTSDAAVLPIKPSVATSAVYTRRKPLTRDLSSTADASTMPARPWSERHESKSYPVSVVLEQALAHLGQVVAGA